MTHLKVSPEASLSELLTHMNQDGAPLLLEGPDGRPLATLMPPDEALADEAEKKFGVRPKRFFKGRPVFDEDDLKNPAFKSSLPEESPEVLARWQAEGDAWEAEQKSKKEQP